LLEIICSMIKYVSCLNKCIKMTQIKRRTNPLQGNRRLRTPRSITNVTLKPWNTR
jgi:hypothetical protein